MGNIQFSRMFCSYDMVSEGFYIHKGRGQKGDAAELGDQVLNHGGPGKFDSKLCCLVVQGEAEVLRKDGVSHSEGRIPNGHYWQKSWDCPVQSATVTSEEEFIYWCLMPVIPPKMWERQLYDLLPGSLFAIAPNDKIQYVFVGDGGAMFEGRSYDAGKLIHINPGQSAVITCLTQTLLLHLWEE